MQINYFALIARIQVKEGMVDQCVDLAETADKAVEASEQGMLFHNFDSDSDDPLGIPSSKPTIKIIAN